MESEHQLSTMLSQHIAPDVGPAGVLDSTPAGLSHMSFHACLLRGCLALDMDRLPEGLSEGLSVPHVFQTHSTDNLPPLKKGKKKKTHVFGKLKKHSF